MTVHDCSPPSKAKLPTLQLPTAVVEEVDGYLCVYLDGEPPKEPSLSSSCRTNLSFYISLVSLAAIVIYVLYVVLSEDHHREWEPNKMVSSARGLQRIRTRRLQRRISTYGTADDLNPP